MNLRLFSFAVVVCVVCGERTRKPMQGTVDQVIKAALKDDKAKVGPITYEDGSVLVEMDMRFKRSDWESLHSGISAQNGLRDEAKRWTNNVVPYIIDSYFNEWERAAIRTGMDEWEKYTCIRFKERTNEQKYIHIKSLNGCWSWVGMDGTGMQEVSLDVYGCIYHHTIVHELGHTIGFHHEQTRPDRDDWVTIYRDNIEKGQEYNFDKYDWKLINDFNVKYDYWSVMHYGSYAFSGNGLITIETKDKEYQDLIGTAPGLSFKDIQASNIMYKCDSHCTKTCPSQAIRSQDCKCWCNGGNPVAPVVEWDGVSECAGADDKNETCFDYDDRCKQWADERECFNNPGYMLTNCRKSCSVCGPDKICQDFDNNCPYWAMIGECRANAGWMMGHCPKSCAKCEKRPPVGDCEDAWDLCPTAAANGDCETYAGSMLFECPVSCRVCGDNKCCRNWNVRCKSWKDEGRCTANPIYYMKVCARACGECEGEDVKDCKDYAKEADCAVWASQGECASNPGWMLYNCAKSCRVCGTDAVCMDRAAACPYWVDDCDKDRAFMDFHCPLTCKRCTGDGKDTADCKNYDPDCPRWAGIGECANNANWMIAYCPRECKVCGDDAICRNWNIMCNTWQEMGECDANPDWMKKNCPRACAVCNGGDNKTDCLDYTRKADCEWWASSGECASNAGWMLYNCAQSCRVCGEKEVCIDHHMDCTTLAKDGFCTKDKPYMDFHCPLSCKRCVGDPKDKPDCKNFDFNCGQWATNGECDANPNWMLWYCPRACRLCGEDPICKNFHADCEKWSDEGECEANPDFMTVMCRPACGLCDDGSGDPSGEKSGDSSGDSSGDKRNCIEIPPDRCMDWEQDCKERAAKGQCFDDYLEMLRVCPEACNHCGKDAICHDYDEGCAGWAASGECDNNPTFMQKYCRKVCNCC